MQPKTVALSDGRPVSRGFRVDLGFDLLASLDDVFIDEFHNRNPLIDPAVTIAATFL